MKSKIIALFLMLCLGGNVYAFDSNKVLVVSSYGTDYQWSNDIIDAIAYTLTSTFPGVELNIEYISSEMFVHTDNWLLKMETIINNYRNFPPLAVVLVSDEAWMAYRSVNTSALKDVPVVLCAVKPHTIDLPVYETYVNTLDMSKFIPTEQAMKEYNATGVLRQMNVEGYLKLMKDVIPGMDKFVFITDKRFYGVYTQMLIKEVAGVLYPNIEAKYISALDSNTDTLVSRLAHVPPTAGLLMTSWLTGEHGFVYSKKYIYQQIKSLLKVPIFLTNDLGLQQGYFLGGYFNKANFWGDKCGDILTSIIKGVDVKTIGPITSLDTECNIDWRIMQSYNLNEDNFPKDTIFHYKPESLFSKYRNYIVSIAIFIFLLLASFIVFVRSHMRLQRAQKTTLASVELVKKSNVKLLEAQRNLTIALEKAEESDRLKSSFISNMSHEIRTPLNAIVGFSSILASIESPKERDEYAEIIERNSNLLLQLVSDILNISKLESGVYDFDDDDADACSICMDVVVAQQVKCNDQLALIFVNPQESVILHTDAGYVSQVLTNFVLNAIKFTNTGCIEIGCYNYDDLQVEFYVKDTGIGIEQDKLESVFGRFVKINSYVEGTGLGLALCKTIIEALGGEIGVESEFGHGSRFWFRLKKQK